MAAVRDFGGWSRKHGAPACLAIVALMIATAIYWWSVRMEGASMFMLTQWWTERPWQLVTYPFALNPLADALSFIFFVLVIAWMIYGAAAIEREIGSGRFVALWVVMSILPALLIGIYSKVAGIPFGFGGPFLPVEAVTIAWCTRFSSQTLMVYGVIPMPAKWFAWLTVAMVFFLYGAMRPEFGVLASLPLVLPWLYASNRIPWLPYGRSARFGGGSRTNLEHAKRHERQDKSYYDDVKRREQERAERERLRKLFESSMKDDETKD